MTDRQELQKELIKRVDACFNEMIESGDWLDSMIINERGWHIGCGGNDDHDSPTKFNEIMNEMFDLAGEDHELVDFILNKAGEYGENEAIKKQREEAFGWEPGKVSFSSNLTQEQVDNHLAMIAQHCCPHCSDEEV